MSDLTLDHIKRALSQLTRPPKMRELARELHIADSAYRTFRRLVRDALKDGEIERLRGGRLVVPTFVGRVKGRLLMGKGGFGFVVPEDRAEEIFVAEQDLGMALHGETVIVELKRFRLGKNREGRVVKVLNRGGTQLVGKLEKTRQGWLLEPDNPRVNLKIELASPDGFAVRPGYVAVVRLDDWRADYLAPTGRIVEVLGPAGSPGVDIDALVKSSGVPVDFSPQAVTETRGIRKTISRTETQKRVDLRDITVFTIDPPDAKDHDDAVSLEKLEDGAVRVGVHIADVSSYVKESSWLDKDALIRGNSIYLVDRVIPMLPPKLSGDVCSLHEGVDRLTVSVFIDYDPNANVKRTEIVESVIQSSASLNYDEVQECLDGRPTPRLEKYAGLLQEMDKLAKKLRGKRLKAGSLDFDLPEPKVVLDVQGNVVDIFRYPRYESHMLIEEFMLAANQVVAKTLESARAPMLFRVHDKPDKLKVKNFEELLHEMGYSFSFKGEITPKKFQRVLDTVKGKADERFVHELLLRSLAKAVYQPVNIGHFGLAFDSYAHFTSPIRRYPDLHLHRVLKLYLHKKLTAATAAKIKETLEMVGKHTSQTEILADELERESVKIKMVDYFAERIGAEFAGTISGVVRTGLFVEVNELLVDGFLPYASFGDDYYVFDEIKHQAVGRRNQKRFRLGDHIDIVVAKVDRERREIEFFPLSKLKRSGRSPKQISGKRK